MTKGVVTFFTTLFMAFCQNHVGHCYNMEIDRPELSQDITYPIPIIIYEQVILNVTLIELYPHHWGL